MRKEEVQKQQSRLQNETLEQCNDKLRDVYMNYKDLVHRCLIDIKQIEKGEKRVFYFKPETFLLEDPEKQRIYREKLLKKITAVPQPDPIIFMGDELHKQLLETVQDKSQPSITRKTLANHFKRRQYTLQHKKYKLLIRWAHHALTTEYMERIGHEATLKYGKMEYDMENSMNRCERLDGEDDFDGAASYPRPNTKAKEGGSLYVENTNLDPVSTIRMDDIEIYLRQLTYDQKIKKLVNKFLARLKWLPLHKRFEIWADAVEAYGKLKEQNLSAQESMIQKIITKAEQIIPKNNEEMKEELRMILENYNVNKFRNKIQSKADALLQSQKSDHELAPMMVDNSIELKIHIIEKALDYGIYGDIELDQGYSFAYQITIFFPTYFQRQIIKSQFSLYDAFAGDEKDHNNVQKRNLQNMIKIDNNIFRDISTTKNNVPSQESMNTDPSFTDLKVIRLKSSAYWIDYICVFPKVTAQLQKQAAFLSTNNPIDSLLRSSINFLDVNDLATVNRILEETARLHQQQQKDTFSSFKKKKKGSTFNQSKKTQDEKKPNLMDEPSNMKDHFKSALKGDVNSDQKDPMNEMPTVNINSLRYMPQHLIHAYYILRHMKSRDNKIKLMYCLNYFRAIQKRMMLDLREFGTRERILGDVVQPIIPAEEANKVSHQNANANYFKYMQEQSQLTTKLNSMAELNYINNSPNGEDKQSLLTKQAEQEEQKDKDYRAFVDGHLKKEHDLVDMKQYKYKGKFCNKIFSTCPVVPRFHATFGEPIENQPLNVEMERIGSIKHATNESVKLMGRVDHVEIDQKTKEVWIKDDFSIYIMYECVFQDMKDLEEDLLKIGSYYIAKHEFLVNTENEKPYPVIDRITIMEDLLQKEFEYQFEKVQLIQCYMESYEHISDPLEQQRLIQIMTDLMGMRPRLNLTSTYFRDSYEAEIMCIKKQTEVLKMMIVNQMNIEKEENKRTQAYLDLTFRIANEQVKGKWTYADAEDFYNELKKRKATMSYIRGGADQMRTIDEEDQQQLNQVQQKETELKSKKHSEEEQSPTKKFLNKIQAKHTTNFSAANDSKENSEIDSEPGFAAVLGLPPITVESLYLQYKEKDETIIDIMNENANYVRIYEGYPDFLIELQGLQSQKLCTYKFSDWSLPINVLDFYEGLDFTTKFYSTIQSVVKELEEVLKPHDNTLLALIELKILERAEIEYRKTRAFFEGDLKEFKGAEYIEDESIVGNPDKITFYVKDFLSHLQKTLKPNIDPFYISKLDIETINFFDFQQLPKEQNPYINQKPMIQEDMNSSLKIADAHVKPNLATYQRFFPQLKEYMRKINIPSLLTMYCNLVEMLRLRQELIFAISESVLLQEIYENQCKLVNRQNYKVLFNDSINFDNYLIDQTKVNFIDDGPGKNIDFDIAVMEFDPLLKSNLNFRNADSIKLLVNTGGLEELRAILHYQTMQKQLLIVGVRMNQLLIDTHVRALNELDLAKKGYSVPNTVIRIQNLLSKSGDGLSYDGFQKERQKFQTNLVNEAAPVIYQVGARKAKLRNTVSKKFSVYLTSVASTYSKVECSLRVMRAYKIKLLHSYCKEVLKEVYHDSMKIQAIQTCNQLRTFSQLFAIDEQILGMGHSSSNTGQGSQIFKFENHDYIENFFSGQNSFGSHDSNQMMFSRETSGNLYQPALNDKVEILDYFMIPSTTTLAKIEAFTYEEIQALSLKYPSFNFSSNPEDNDCEQSIKDVLPVFKPTLGEYPREDPDKERVSLRISDFQHSYDYSTTHYSQMFTYYNILKRILYKEIMFVKTSTPILDAINLEDCIEKGLPFWNVDPEQQYGAIKLEAQEKGNEKLAERILNKIVAEKRAKINLADDIMNAAQVIQTLIQKIQTSSNTKIVDNPKANLNPHYIPKQKINEYLITYMEFRYFFLLHTMDKLLDSYYQKGWAKEIKIVSDTYNQLTKKDHVKITYKHNAFHINNSYTKPEDVSLETLNLSKFYGTNEETDGFLSSIQPIINEHAMSPPQITLYQGIYLNQKQRGSQYAGQIPQNPRTIPALRTAFINLSDQQRLYINSTAHSVKSFLKDYLEVIHKENADFNDDGLTFDQIKKCKKFLQELIQARQLKMALMCWLSCSTVPLDPNVYNQYLAQYKNDIFWKIMNEKDSLPQISPNGGQFDKSPTKVREDSSLIGGGQNNEMNKKAESSMLLSQQLINMQNQVLIDQVQTCKAEIIVLSNEIERNIVKAAIKAVESESNALANCFSLSVKQIDMHIHPFQQFASTLYSEVDPNSHLDMVTKVSEVQRFITKLRNRGTEVETLTSGPGMVFTIKDFNECLQILCRGLIKYGERELRSRSEEMSKKEAHYIQLLYCKDRKIENMEQRIINTRDNLDKLINSKMYEKGNQLIYELDCVNRQLRLFKDNVFAMEKELRSSIRAEFADQIRRNMRDLDISMKRFNDFKTDVTTKVKADLAQEEHYIQKVIKKKAEEFKNLSAVTSYQQKHPSHKQSIKTGQSREMNNNMVGTGQSEFFFGQHLEEIQQMTEREAREELAKMWEMMRKMRIFWKTKEVLTIDKYEKEIFTLKKQLTSNACLWEQLAEAEKREKVLKQELVFTQQSLAASEKVIEKLKDDLRKSESDRIRLNQYKTNKSQRLEELEGKVRKFEVMENINLEKLIDTLSYKEKEINKLKDIEKHFDQRLNAIEQRKDVEVQQVKGQYQKEITLKKDVLERLEGLRMELRMLEKNEGSMAEVWKTKCKELVEICNKLKIENDVLRNRVQQQAYSSQDNDQGAYQYQEGQFLPKLMNNNNQSKMLTNIQASKYGMGSASHTRHSSNAKNESLMNPSLDKSLLAANALYDNSVSKSNQINASHQRVRSIHDQSLSKITEASFKQSQQQASTNQKINSQRFAVLGQTAQIGKGYQSVRTSQVGNNGQFTGGVGTNDINQNAKIFREGMMHMSNTSTSFSKNFNSNQNTGNIGKSPAVLDSSQHDKSLILESGNKRSRASTDRYNDKKSQQKFKRKSNQDLDAVVQTGSQDHFSSKRNESMKLSTEERNAILAGQKISQGNNSEVMSSKISHQDQNEQADEDNN